jgi:hypothetical protein
LSRAVASLRSEAKAKEKTKPEKLIFILRFLDSQRLKTLCFSHVYARKTLLFILTLFIIYDKIVVVSDGCSRILPLNKAAVLSEPFAKAFVR